jgi:hypothetical protein
MVTTIVGLCIAVVLIGIAWLNHNSHLKRSVLGSVALLFVSYALSLLAASLTSRETLLAFNEPKAFCGFYLDCHMHAAVVGVRQTKTIGDNTADGRFYVVSVRVFSDAKRASIGLLEVDARVEDASDNSYTRDLTAEQALPAQPVFEQKLGPGDSFTKEIVFNLPVNVKAPRLDIREGYAIDHFIESVLICDEDSLFHERKYFDLTEQVDPEARARS